MKGRPDAFGVNARYSKLPTQLVLGNVELTDLSSCSPNRCNSEKRMFFELKSDSYITNALPSDHKNEPTSCSRRLKGGGIAWLDLAEEQKEGEEGLEPNTPENAFKMCP